MVLGPVGPVGWPAGQLAQLARGGLFCLFVFFSILFSVCTFSFEIVKDFSSTK